VSTEDSYDIAIIGGGAAGFAAAIFAGQTLREAGSDASVVVLDGVKSLGAKILVAGGGRCNVTHHRVAPEDYNGPRNVVRNVLRSFPVAATVDWFGSMGVELKREETGKLFPVTDSARTVLEALLNRCRELGVRLLTDHRVRGLTPLPPGGAGGGSMNWRLLFDVGQLQARRLILATGGRSLPRTGSDGGAYAMLTRLGHTVTDTHAALVPLVLDISFLHKSLSGISLDVELSTFAANKRIDVRTGSLLWTHFGISGPVVMDASRHWVIAEAEGRQPKLTANFLPGRTFEQVDAMLQPVGEGRTVGQRVGALLPRRVADAIVHHAGLTNGHEMNQLPKDGRRRLVHALTALELPVIKHRGWNYAEVTAGGVPLVEIDYRTTASRKAAAVHIVGEALDVDGRIGGFNFQWAWATGRLAGIAAARALEPRMNTDQHR
jgi:predicted Rossmann fold flavoprotein